LATPFVLTKEVHSLTYFLIYMEQSSGFISLPNRDIAIWLSSKLEEPWSSEKITSYLTSEMLQAIKLKFSGLETVIKLRVLFAFLGIRKKKSRRFKRTR